MYFQKDDNRLCTQRVPHKPIEAAIVYDGT